MACHKAELYFDIMRILALSVPVNLLGCSVYDTEMRTAFCVYANSFSCALSRFHQPVALCVERCV